ncbi:MAG: phage capsid protein [Ruminococcus sp.]|nr:phage capsid protein [Ruminococcus sp.]
MISITEIEKAMGISIPVSSKMQEAIRSWSDLYTNESYWLMEDVISLELASGIASKTAKFITNNGKSWIIGSERADYLQQQYSDFMTNIRTKTEFACALGGVVFKPYLLGKKIKVETITADRFYPVEFGSDGEMTAAVFMERYTSGKTHYTRLEYHRLDTESGVYTVQNRAFSSKDSNTLGSECRLDDVDQWSGYTSNMVIRDVERPLFAYFRMPDVNNIDIGSPLGMSCYKKAAEHIRQADQHWEKIMWEFQGSELAIMAESSMFKVEQGKPAIPRGKKRLFRILNGTGNGDLFKEFSPAIRDNALFHGFNRILQRIEFDCDLAYGTISDPQTVEKTAEEVRASKDTSRSSMQEKQKALEDALKQVVWIMNEYADYYKLAPSGSYEAMFEWGDGIAIDREAEYARRLQLATAGKYKWEKFLAWYFGCSEEKAAEMIPEPAPLFGGDVNANAGLL